MYTLEQKNTIYELKKIVRMRGTTDQIVPTSDVTFASALLIILDKLDPLKGKSESYNIQE